MGMIDILLEINRLGLNPASALPLACCEELQLQISWKLPPAGALKWNYM
jgi:hypothetical protein